MASVNVKIPTQLRPATGGLSEVKVDGSTVREALDSLFEDHVELKERITDGGELRRFVNVYLGGEDIRFSDGLDSVIPDDAELTILPAVAGG